MHFKLKCLDETHFFQCNSTQTVEMSVDVYVALHVLLQAILPYFVPFLIMVMPLSSLINLHNKARLLHPGLILSSFEVYSYGQAISLCLCHPSVLACQHCQVAQQSCRPRYQESSSEKRPNGWIFRLLISMYAHFFPTLSI